MQKQKTIAKWLAIILLLTVIVACYFILRAVTHTQSPSLNDIAGADDRGGSTVVTPPVEDVTVPPVYSEFPRNAEVVNGVTVCHIGGDNDERLLDSLYYGGKRLVLFSSLSTQYDVQESGIHIAVFDGDRLMRTVKLAGVDEEYVSASLVQNGLLVITRTPSDTRLRLYDNNCNMIAQNTCAAYSSYKLYISGTTATLFTTDGNYLYAMTITKTLDAVRSNFVYPLSSGKLLYAMKLGTETTLIVQTKTDVGILTYSATGGFTFKTQLINCEFMQLLPIVSSGKQALIISAKTDDGVRLASIGSDQILLDSYLLEGENNAVCLPQDNNNIAVLAGRTQYTFCSHLELQSTSLLSVDENIYATLNAVSDSDTIYTAVNGEADKFVISCGERFSIVTYDDGKVSHLFSAVGTSPLLVREPAMQGAIALSVLFNATSANSFSYMCFGENDVFYLTLTSQLTSRVF